MNQEKDEFMLNLYTEDIHRRQRRGRGRPRNPESALMITQSLRLNPAMSARLDAYQRERSEQENERRSMNVCMLELITAALDEYEKNRPEQRSFEF